MSQSNGFASRRYWEARYRQGGTSGKGSAGRLARFKAEMINGIIAGNAIRSVIDLGCGDAEQLSRFALPADYVGVDVSETALMHCAARFPHYRFLPPERLRTVPPADLTIALDVIYHLVEDAAYLDAMRILFAWAKRFVVIYASNLDEGWPSPHVRHRRFTDHVAATEPDWRLLAHLPNPYPFDGAHANETSFADFYVYGRREQPCSIMIPVAE